MPDPGRLVGWRRMPPERGRGEVSGNVARMECGEYMESTEGRITTCALMPTTGLTSLLPLWHSLTERADRTKSHEVRTFETAPHHGMENR
jgi:hypothetical protein